MLRRERISSLAWILILGGIVIALVPGMFVALPPDARSAIVDSLSLPAMISMIGPDYATRLETYGALFTNFMLLFTALTVGIMNIFLVVRLTRADEEKGRLEVLRSLPVGRMSNLSAALISVVVVNIALGLVVGLGMYGFGAALEDTGMCFNGSMLFGATLAVTGLVFAALTALICQLTASARTAMGYSFMAMGVFFMLRAPGDMNTEMEILALISPLGLPLRTMAYIDNNWWPIWIMIGIFVVISALAFYFTSIRDIDQGMIPAKPGRANGSHLMSSPQGLAVKLLRVSIIVWLASIFIVGVSYGAVLGGLDEFIATSEVYQQLMLGPFGITIPEDLPVDEAVAILRETVAFAGFTVPQLFSAMINLIMGIFASVPAMLFVLKVKSEETEMRSELVLATATCRKKYLAGFVSLAFLMALMIQLVSALGMYVAAAGALYDISDFPLSFAIQNALIYVSAIWVMIGLAVFLIGILPKATAIVWGFLAYTFLLLFFGQGFGIFPEWLTYISPYAFVTQLPLGPGESVNFVAIGIKLVVAICLTVAGFHFYGKRDINAITH